MNREMFNPVRILAASLYLLAAGVDAGAGEVTFVGREDNASSFRTTTVAKGFDPNGNNVYGEAGYVLYTTQGPPNAADPLFIPTDPLTFDDGTFKTLSSIPSYLTLASNGQDNAVGGFNYTRVDDPTATPGPDVPQIESGLALVNFIDQGTEQSLIDITIGDGSPKSGLLIGVMMGIGEDLMSSVRLTQTGGSGSGSATATVVNSPSLFFEFFRVTGANAGDTFTLYLTKAGGFNPNVAYVGLTFDELGATAVPEPGTFVLASIGLLGLLGHGRLRQRRSEPRSGSLD